MIGSGFWVGCVRGGFVRGADLDPSTSVYLHSGKVSEKDSLATNVFVMDWLSQALAHPFRRYSFLAPQSTIVPKVRRPWSKSETESSHLQSEHLH